MKKTFVITVILVLSALSQIYSQGKIKGYMFGDYFYNITRDASINSIKNVATKREKSFQAFQFRRVYLTYDNKISNDFKTRIRLEMGNSILANNGKFSVNLKDAYLNWKIFGDHSLIFGLQNSPSFGVAEKLWGYRSLEKTIMDLRKIESSRDLGIGLKGKLDKKGILSYWILIGNGKSNKPEDNKYKRIYAHLKITPNKKLTITLNGDFSPRGEINDPHSNKSNKNVSNSMFTSSIFIGYKFGKQFMLGGESFIQSTKNGFDNGTALDNNKSIGISVYGFIRIKENLNFVGRFDYFDPNTNSLSKGDSRNYILAGLDFKVHKQVSIMPNIQVETYESLPSGKSFDASVTGRITFYYKFL